MQASYGEEMKVKGYTPVFYSYGSAASVTLRYFSLLTTEEPVHPIRYAEGQGSLINE